MMKMERLRMEILWVAAIIQFAMCTTATNDISTSAQSDPGAYAWSAWGAWSPCSRTCGGGVAVQKRECLPRPKSTNTTVSTPTVRVSRQTRGADCVGVARRYHQCNMAPCHTGVASASDMRAEQCSAYDRRPFRERFYTWVPYIDGDSPCTLNCRPLGKHFYASLALVADGTPCTRPGLRAICIQGSCKVVGREAVLAGNTHDMRCGRRLVSGLFSRPRLPLGYSYVTTVPRGACRLNVTEIISSENYIALKITNGSYIMNGEFAVSAPGTYDAEGARFIYSRVAGLDSVFALGPIHYPIDIMILYTQPNPSIKYEYFTESQPGELDAESITRSAPELPSTMSPKHTRRHHSLDAFPRPVNVPRYKNVNVMQDAYSGEEFEENIVGDRRFIWKILSYSQCSRTCGGGFQVGKFRCVEASSTGDREVAPVHCTGSSPASRRRRCGNVSCPPRWRAAAWSSCPACGPATRTRIVGCVQDHSRGITKISDQKCPSPKPSTTEPCDIPDCPDVRQVDRRVKRPREHVDAFHEGPVYSVAVNGSEDEIGPEYNFNAAASWLFTEWSECVGWCVGGGLQTRGIRCSDPSGCTPMRSPDASQSCSPKISCEPQEGHWFTGEWSPCSSPCNGKQIRGVLCIGGTGRHLKDSGCKTPRPAHERNCEEKCTPTWYFSEWSQCVSNCSSNTGVQRRTVWCARGAGAARDDACVAAGAGERPPAQRPCTPLCSVTVPPVFIESQKVARSDTTTSTTTTTTTTEGTTTQQYEAKDCEDKLSNCALAVQARLCHYKYYIHNCCYSCKGR
ncbi:thrombospondin type-1 domain-containing protein 4-like [Cydia fagiglandana]|uniref:thrombospondin type-1 domain-containing protein 4-like n=1 Tax=Cydia fagiglandana TaxID=1458189 RepID=UPI002FEE4185